MNKAVFAAGGFVAVCLGTGSPVWAQDPVKVAPEIYKVRLQNEQIRVLDIHIEPGGKSPTHSHPAHVIVAFSPCKIKFGLPNGKAVEAEMKAQQVVWSGPVTHSSENVGSSECHALNIELKE
jgi:quercetin dioxygenase-like cupin family protein